MHIFGNRRIGFMIREIPVHFAINIMNLTFKAFHNGDRDNAGGTISGIDTHSDRFGYHDIIFHEFLVRL